MAHNFAAVYQAARLAITRKNYFQLRNSEEWEAVTMDYGVPLTTSDSEAEVEEAAVANGGSFLDGELFDPSYCHQRFYIQPRRQQSSRSVCPAQQGTSVACTPDKFAIQVDTRHFTPEEITVKTQDNCVVIHGKHEEKSDDRGCFIKREFTRRYVLPEDVHPQSVKCHLKPNGLLALEAPRKNGSKKEEAKPMPIEIKHEGASGDASKKK